MEKEFKEIGKKMPYSVPDGFFEGITPVTLEKARLREKAARGRRLVIQWVAVAALLTGVVFTGIRLLTLPEAELQEHKGGGGEMLVRNGTAHQEVTHPVQEGKVTGEEKTASGTSGEKVIPPVTMEAPDNGETVEELLAGLSDQELKEWGTLVHNDPFFTETENNNNYENN